MMKFSLLKSIPFFLLLVSANLSFSQACKKYMDKNVIDYLTGDTIASTREVIFSQESVEDSRRISFRVMDGNRLYVHFSSGKSTDLIFGSDVLLIFASGEEMTIQIEQAFKEKEGTEMLMRANCRIYYKTDFQRFYEDKLVKIKLLGSRQEYALSSKDQTAVLASALCLAENWGLDNFNFDSERNTTLTPDPSGGAFSVGSGSVVTVSGTMKCEYEKDTLIDSKDVVRLSKWKEIGGSPYKLKIQVGLYNEKITLYCAYAVDLGNVSTRSYIVFRFTDGTTKKLNHTGDYVNSKTPVFETNITFHKDDLMNKDLERVRLSFSEYFADISISNKQYLADYLRYCLQ